jgi:hypothetical protein
MAGEVRFEVRRKATERTATTLYHDGKWYKEDPTPDLKVIGNSIMR